MELVITGANKYNKIFKCDPYKRKKKKLRITYIDIDDKNHDREFNEDAPFIINKIKTIIYASYGIGKDRDVSVLETLNRLLKVYNPRYLYLTPSRRKKGFNDILTAIYAYQSVAEKTGRTLLVNFKSNKFGNIPYDCNLGQVLKFKQDHIICDTDEIDKIMNTETDLRFLTRRHCHYSTCYDCVKKITNRVIMVPQFGQNGAGRSIDIHRFFYSSIIMNESILQYCIEKKNTLPTPYTYLQIRCSDRKSDYVSLLKSNIRSFDTNIYIATDNLGVINYAREKYKNHNFYNFTDYESEKGLPLHFANIDGIIKFRDILCDISLVFSANNFFSNSRGGFTLLCRHAFINKHLNFLK